jgi:hypothetical protein
MTGQLAGTGGESLARGVLSALLDKYENSEAFRKGEPTQARIQLRFTDSLVPGYASGRLDPDDRTALHHTLVTMADSGFIDLKWVKFEEGNILERVYLKWERIHDIYAYLGRTPQRQKLSAFTAEMEQWLEGLVGEDLPGEGAGGERFVDREWPGEGEVRPGEGEDLLDDGLPGGGEGLLDDDLPGGSERLPHGGLAEAWRFLLNWADDVLSFVHERGRIPSSLIPEEDGTRALLLRALAGLVRMRERSLPVRLFSKRELGNSKVFEKQVQSHVIRLVRRYWSVGHPQDIEAPDDDATLLRELGIESGHEDITFCGPIRLRYQGTEATEATEEIDASVFPYGLAIDASDVHRITITEARVSRILTIENKANYRAYVRHHRQSDELVVYLGGFASPAQRVFLRLLRDFLRGRVSEVGQESVALGTMSVRALDRAGCDLAALDLAGLDKGLSRADASDQPTVLHHWGDLDYGGILILQNLRNSCWPEAVPWRMEPELLDEYIDYVESIDDAYRTKLERLLESDVYAWAHPLIQRILTLGATLEQEALLLSD